MNKVKFDADVLSLISADYEHIQDSVESDIQKSTRQTLAIPYVPSTLRGFNIMVSLSDPTKIKMYHEGGIGNAITYDSTIIETLDEKDNISLSNTSTGIVNYIYLKYYSIDGSYNKSTQVIDEGIQRAIDLSNYTKQYDRLIDKWDIIAYTFTEYSLLDSNDQKDLICLGSTIAQGAGNPLTEISNTGRVTAKTFIADESINPNHLDPTFQINQDQVDNSQIYDDNYTSTSQNLEDDLNRLRTELRLIKGTVNWEDNAGANLQSFDTNINKLHLNGVFDYQDDLDYIITSSGTNFQVKSGKALVEGIITTILPGSIENIPLGLADRQYIGNWDDRTGGENHWCGIQPFTFYLNHAPITNLHIIDSVTPEREYIEGIDYTINTSTGEVITKVGGDIVSETVSCFYEWGYSRYDIIEVTIGSVFQLKTGTPAANPLPPAVTDNNLRLYFIYRPPLIDFVIDNQVFDCRKSAMDVREVFELLPQYYVTQNWAPNNFTYVKSDGTIDTLFSEWTLTNTPLGYTASASTSGAKLRTVLLASENDELYIRADKITNIGTITIRYEEIIGSGILNKSIDIDLHNNVNLINLITYIDKGLSRGYHMIEIELNHDVLFTMYGLIIGKMDFYYVTQGMEINELKAARIDTYALNTVWEPIKDYYLDDFVISSSGIYICTGQHTASTNFQNDFADGWWAFPVGDGAITTPKLADNAVTDIKLADDAVDTPAIKDGAVTREKFYDGGTFITNLQNRLDASENKLLDLALTSSYLAQRRVNNSNFFIEPFINESQTAMIETSSNKLSEVMDDTDWFNNWKDTEETFDFRNGFLRPQKQPFMLEVIDEYNLEGVGQTNKCALSQYDSVRDCMWMISNAGSAETTIGEITKLSPIMKDGKVEVLARYYIPASGVASTYWTGIDADDTHIYFVLYGANAASKCYQIKINSDGTLGATGYEIGNGETINLTFPGGSVSGVLTNGLTGHYNDVIIWDDNDIMIALSNGTTAVTLINIAKSGMGAGASGNQTGLEKYVGGTQAQGKSITKYGNDLYIRINDATDDYRFIYKFDITTDIVSDVFIKASGRFETTRNVDQSSVSEGISVGKFGDILEITSTAANGKFISKRALKNALWAENQVVGEYKMLTDAYSGDISVPTIPYGCMVDVNSNYYTTENANVAQDSKIYRYKPDGTVNSLKVTGATSLWLNIYDLTTDGTYVYVLGADAGIYYDVIRCTLVYLTTQLDSNSNVNIDDGVNWAHSSGIGTTCADEMYSLCYDSDDDQVLVLIDGASTGTLDKIGTITDLTNFGTADVWDDDVYDLPPSVAKWIGIAYKNEKIFVGDTTGATTPSKIYVIDKNRSNATAWFRLHIYQDPSNSFEISGRKGIAFDGNDLVCINATHLKFYRMKILEDPDALQLHTFIDANNILLSNNVSCATPIVKRHFDPEDFADIRDCPDMNYCAVGYGDEGLSLLHLDEYLSNKSSTGKDRYDVRKIRIQHYKEGFGNIVSLTNATAAISAIFIVNDSIIIGNGVGGEPFPFIDLKSGKVYFFYIGAAYPGTYYDGTLSERNDGKGFTGSVNIELASSHVNIRKFHAHTFTKEDSSDYQGENPVTFVAIGTDGGCDLLRIDWDSNGNRTPVKVWNNIFASVTYGQYACWIASSGHIFGAEYGATGNVNVLLENGENAFVWNVSSDSQGGGNTISGGIGGYVMDIAPNSRCWKTPSGEWRHQLLCGTYDGNAVVFNDLVFVDVENETKKLIWNSVDDYYGYWNVDIFEDRVFAIRNEASTTRELMFFKKLRFDDNLSTNYKENWTMLQNCGSGGGGMSSSIRPLFTSYIYTASGQSKVCRYSSDHNFLSVGSSIAGLQFFHFPHLEGCIHESTNIDCDSPTQYHYIQNALLPGSWETNE